ncbi:MAG: hypothetical protein IKO47_13585 [Ruminococcus sp.]|nr:hypothetical protein [Ruminococcus sp.]
MDEMHKCRLCGKQFPESEMSEEHYPAHCVGNDDIIQLNIVKAMDDLMSGHARQAIVSGMKKGLSYEDAAGAYFDNELAKDLYPKGRTARTLCRECNTFLGKYDSAYLRFYNANGDPAIVRGYQERTKIQIIKSIYAKFLSLPETQDENFDFIEFIKDESMSVYSGEWRLYFVKRDFSTDLMGLADIGTGKLDFEEGVVYELSDDRFIFNLMNFEKHSCYEMNSIFDILNRNYSLIVGVGENGGYHGQVMLTDLFRQMQEQDERREFFP